MDNKLKLLILFTALLFFIVTCGQNAFEEKTKEETAFVKGNYRIIFSLPGDDFASTVELEQLQTLKGKILKQGAGKPVGTGAGMGNMVLIVNINSEEAMSTIIGIIDDNYPFAKYRIEPEQPF